jgi:hypothetical protein
MIAANRTLAASALAILAACVARDVVATAVGDDRESYCQSSGPPVLVDGTCTGDLTAAVFRHAVCGCGALNLGGDLDTDGFDSRVAPWTAGGTGGDIGGNAGLDFGGDVGIGGNLIISGGGVQAGTDLRVRGDLDAGGGLGRPSSSVSVGGAARIGGDVDVGTLDVTGTLTTPAGSVQQGSITAGALVTAAVAIPPPCRCAPGEIIDVAAIVADHRLANHDAAVGLAPDALADVHGDATLELPCGRFYLTRIQAVGGGRVTLRATGRTAVFVAENVTLDGLLAVEVAAGAELDLFVAGVLNLPGGVRLGDPARPQALRIYVASAGAINLSSGSLLAGNLYAPAADLTPSAPLEVFGALFVNHLALNSPLTVHHDRAVASAGDACRQ